jgi:spore germination cell wall hydrolase CwlJ-like protein
MQLRLYLILILLASSFIIYDIASNKKIVDRLLTIGYTQLTEESQKEVDCLADNIYYEAGYEPEQGKVAVALVTMNRLQDPRFPKDICSVVKQKVNHTCQFTWFCENKSKNNKQSTNYWKAREVALHVYVNYDKISDITYGALYYHADYVNPKWKHLEKTTVVGRHIFYKESEKL